VTSNLLLLSPPVVHPLTLLSWESSDTYVHLCQECHLKSYINCIIWTVFNKKFSNTEAQLITNFHYFSVYLFRLRLKTFRKRNLTLWPQTLPGRTPTFLPQLSNSWNISNTVSDMQPLVGMFTKLWKITTDFVMYACPHGTAWLPLDEFSWNLKFWGSF
jgi:hypothetical protein